MPANHLAHPHINTDTTIDAHICEFRIVVNETKKRAAFAIARVVVVSIVVVVVVVVVRIVLANVVVAVGAGVIVFVVVAAKVELAVLVAIVVLVVGFAFVRHGGGGSRRINESYDLVGELSLLWPNVRSTAMGHV